MLVNIKCASLIDIWGKIQFMLVNIKCASLIDVWGEVQFMLVNIKCAADICLSLTFLGRVTVHGCEYQVCSIHRQLWHLGRGAVHDILTFVFENRVKLQFLLVNYYSAEFFLKFFAQILVLNAM